MRQNTTTKETEQLMASEQDFSLELYKLATLPVDTVFGIGGHIFQRTTYAYDSMPSTKFRPGAQQIGATGDQWDYVQQLTRKGYKATIYRPVSNS